MTGLVGTVEDLVVEDGEVEGEAQPDGVGGLHLTLADIKCILKNTHNILAKIVTNISHTNTNLYEQCVILSIIFPPTSIAKPDPSVSVFIF